MSELLTGADGESGARTRTARESGGVVVRLTGTLTCADAGEAAIVRDHLADHVALTRAEPGCLSFGVEATSDPLVWDVAEVFVDAEAFAAHQERVSSGAWGAATAGIRRDYVVVGIPGA